MDGENNGKAYENGWFGGTTIFGNTHIGDDLLYSYIIYWYIGIIVNECKDP